VTSRRMRRLRVANITYAALQQFCAVHKRIHHESIKLRLSRANRGPSNPAKLKNP
jgi:hypothetical protein